MREHPIPRPVLVVTLIAIVVAIAALMATADDSDGGRISLNRADTTSPLVPSTVSVPELPGTLTVPSIEVPEIDPPTIPPFEIDVPDSPVLPVPTVEQRACPRGRPRATATEFEATRSNPDSSPDDWSVTAEGRLRNDTSASIAVSSIRLEIDASPDTQVHGFPADGQLDPGEATTWSATTYVRSSTEPAAGSASVSWFWSDGAVMHCPTE